MAYIPSECSLEEYERVIYSGDAKNRLYVKHGDTVIGTNGDNNASPFASKLTIKRRILKNGSKTITLNNFISQEIDLVLHDYKIEDLSEEIEIKIGTFIDSVMDYVYVPIGKFLIQDNPTTDKNKTTYKLRDFSVNFDFYYNGKPLIDDNGGSVTKMQILQDICKQAGVNCYIKSFIGFNDEIGIYDNSVTARMYISYLAEQAGCIAYINRKGELDFKTISSNNLIERNIDSSIIEKFKSGDSFKVSKVLYESGLIKFENGTNDYDTLYISADNPYITNQQQLDRLLPNIINFEINSFETGKVLGNPTIDPFDLIKVEYNNITYKTLAQYTLNFSGTMTSSYSTKIEHETKQSNIISNGTSAIKKYVKTEIDNVEAELKIEIGDFEDDTNNKLLSVTGRVDKLESSISDVANITISQKSDEATVSFEKINESEPIRIEIRPIGEDISNLLISNNMLIDKTFKLKQRLILFENLTTGKPEKYMLPNDLLYYDSENYDEFILDYNGHSCIVNKKVGYNEDGTKYLLDKPKIIEYDYPTIPLKSGDYKVSIVGYDKAYIFVQLMTQNIYTNQFYTKAETNSKISQTANTITSDIDAKLKNYSTTKEMNNKINQSVTDAENSIKSEISNTYTTKEETTKLSNKIEQKITDEVNSINLEVNKKANTSDVNASLELKIDKNDNNQVVSMINASADIINLKGNRVTIDSDNFELTADGKITATAGDIGGFDLTENEFKTNISVTRNYTNADTEKLQKYLIGEITLTNEELDYYDANGDGVLNILDLLRMQRIILGHDSPTTTGTFEINSTSTLKSLAFKDENGKTTTSVGLEGIGTKNLSADVLSVDSIQRKTRSGVPLFGTEFINSIGVYNTNEYSLGQYGEYDLYIIMGKINSTDNGHISTTIPYIAIDTIQGISINIADDTGYVLFKLSLNQDTNEVIFNHRGRNGSGYITEIYGVRMGK